MIAPNISIVAKSMKFHSFIHSCWKRIMPTRNWIHQNSRIVHHSASSDMMTCIVVRSSGLSRTHLLQLCVFWGNIWLLTCFVIGTFDWTTWRSSLATAPCVRRLPPMTPNRILRNIIYFAQCSSLLLVV